MNSKNILLALLLASLCGCKAEKPASTAALNQVTRAALAEAGNKSPVAVMDAMQLARKNNCLSCHAVDKKVIGPAWKDVAARYRGNDKAEALLMSKIVSGGSGAWGVMVMTPSPQLGEEERRILARYVLSLQ